MFFSITDLLQHLHHAAFVQTSPEATALLTVSPQRTLTQQAAVGLCSVSGTTGTDRLTERVQSELGAESESCMCDRLLNLRGWWFHPFPIHLHLFSPSSVCVSVHLLKHGKIHFIYCVTQTWISSFAASIRSFIRQNRVLTVWYLSFLLHHFTCLHVFLHVARSTNTYLSWCNYGEISLTFSALCGDSM